MSDSDASNTPPLVGLTTTVAEKPPSPDPTPGRELATPHWIYRHTLPIRLCHWINVVCLIVLLMSGLQIFNAHPHLYWGERSDPDQALLSMFAMQEEGERKGFTEVFGRTFDTTGVFGASPNADGVMQRRGFPAWATLPSDQWLAAGRRWHLFFAWLLVINGLVYVLYALISRHLSRNLVPWWKDLRGLGRSIVDHLRFRHPKGVDAVNYNVLQKITYFGVIFILGPLIVLTGFTMSPWLNSAFPQLLTVFDGRQSARTIHFLLTFAFVAFILIHVFMVIVTGLWNNLRSMLSGRYRIPMEKKHHEQTYPE